MTRTDTHAPSRMDPAEYQYLGEFYQGTEEMMCDAYRNENARTANLCRQHGRFEGGNFAADQRCDHCGTRFAFGVAYLHIPTDEVIKVGHQCAAFAFDFESRTELLRAKGMRERKAAQQRAEVALAAAEFTAEHEWLVAELEQRKDTNNFLASLLDNLNRYGNLTDRQIDAACEAIRKCEQRDGAFAAAPPAAPVVTGNGVTVTGTILSTRVEDTPYGTAYKMLVVDDRGFKVWGSIPSSLNHSGIGSRISFVANIERSNDDDCFGFFKRPRKAVNLDK